MATVGWQGITLKVPADWSLVGVSGDAKKGYLRVDGTIGSALEVRWSPVLGKAPELVVKAREFLATLEKSSRKSRTKFSSKIREEDGGSVGFTWRGERLGQGRLIHCERCDRVLIAQVISSPEENVSHLAPAILGSIADHRDDGRVNWALYGLDFTVPEGYRIEKHSLMSGFLSLTFKNGLRSLVVERWGLAETLLEGCSIDEWYRKDAVPDIKGYRLVFTDNEVMGHDGLKVEGRRGGVKQAVRAAAYSLTLHEYPSFLTGYAWLCKDSNRLLGVRATHAAGEQIAEEVRDSIRCH